MAFTPVNCNGCGAELEVGATTNFVTCIHCNGRLRIVRTNSSIFTEPTRSAADAFEAKLDEIDRQWEKERGSLLIGPMGNAEPASGLGIFFLIMTAFMAGLVVLLALLVDSTLFLLLLPLTFGLLFGLAHYHAGKHYELAFEAYCRRRAAVKYDEFIPRETATV